jgi:recombination protein RecT
MSEGQGQTTKSDRVRTRVKQVNEAFVKRIPKFTAITRGGIDMDKYQVFLVNEIYRIPSLIECSDISLMKAVMLSMSLELYIGDGFGSAWILPFKNKKGLATATFVPGYKGLVDLGRRSGQISKVNAFIHYEKDEFDIGFGDNPFIRHKPLLGQDRGKKMGAYGVLHYTAQDLRDFEYMEAWEIEKRKAGSASVKGSNAAMSPWFTWEEQMWKKTAVKNSFRMAPLSAMLSRALQLDDRAEKHGTNTKDDFIDVEGIDLDADDELAEAVEADTPEKKAGEDPDGQIVTESSRTDVVKDAALAKVEGGPSAGQRALSKALEKQLVQIASDFGFDEQAKARFLSLAPPVPACREHIVKLQEKDIDVNNVLRDTQQTTWEGFMQEQTGSLL